MKLLLLSFVIGMSLPTSVNGGNVIVHEGLLNNEGCHNNKKSDRYHCPGSNKKENLNLNLNI